MQLRTALARKVGNAKFKIRAHGTELKEEAGDCEPLHCTKCKHTLLASAALYCPSPPFHIHSPPEIESDRIQVTTATRTTLRGKITITTPQPLVEANTGQSFADYAWQLCAVCRYTLTAARSTTPLPPKIRQRNPNKSAEQIGRPILQQNRFPVPWISVPGPKHTFLLVALCWSRGNPKYLSIFKKKFSSLGL